MWRTVITGSTTLTAMPLLAGKVYADSEEKMCVTIKDLSVYDNPESQVELVPEKISAYREGISEIRKKWFALLDENQSKIDRACQIWNTSKAHTIDLGYRIWDNKERSAIIATAGVIGIAAARGRYIRGTVYGTGAALTAAAICFPAETVDLAKSAGKTVVSKVIGDNKGDGGKS